MMDFIKSEFAFASGPVEENDPEGNGMNTYVVSRSMFLRFLDADLHLIGYCHQSP